jgi:hypothetical protein
VLHREGGTGFEDVLQLIERGLALLGADVLENVRDFVDAFVFEGFEGVDFGHCAYVLVVVVVVFDALGAERFDAGHGRAEVGEGLAVVLGAGVLDELGREFGGVQVRVVAAAHRYNSKLYRGGLIRKDDYQIKIMIRIHIVGCWFGR